MSIRTPTDILGPNGKLAEILDGYEPREPQLEMASTVSQALEQGEHAIIEAPTGVGKSFAYLIPAIQHALSSKTPVVISTGTIALQEQLVDKDVPVLQEVFPELKAVLVKGRNNYVSLRRLQHALDSDQATFTSRDDISELKQIGAWAKEATDGDRADLGYDPPPAVWRAVQSDAGNCQGRKCPRYRECFFYKARREIEDANLLIVNHHLYFSDLALRDDHAGILPAHSVVVFDEAHQLEDIATDHLGTSLAESNIRYHLDGLWNGRKGILASMDGSEAAKDAVDATRDASQAFWGDVVVLANKLGGDHVRLPDDQRPDNPLSPALLRLAKAISDLRGLSDDDNQNQELRAQADKTLQFAHQLSVINDGADDDFVTYATIPASPRASVALASHPLSVAGALRERLFGEMGNVILTSATLAADDSERFLFLRKRLGLDGGLARRLDSPFDYHQQAKLLLNRSTIDPNSERFAYALGNWLGDFLDDAEGGTFILFTSYRQLDLVHGILRPRLDRAGRFVLRQGDRMGRSQMLDLFKRTGNAILFGTASFWEGVDVRGDALRNVVITKLPFVVPDHPLVEARHREIERQGGNPFMLRTVPEAIIRLKQGIGRLIRTSTDSGTIAICDHRILSRQYGRYFLRALPDMPTEHFSLDEHLPGG